MGDGRKPAFTQMSHADKHQDTGRIRSGPLSLSLLFYFGLSRVVAKVIYSLDACGPSLKAFLLCLWLRVKEASHIPVLAVALTKLALFLPSRVPSLLYSTVRREAHGPEQELCRDPNAT